MTELGNLIHDIEPYHPISKLHQQNLDNWLGFCANGTALTHLPHPAECLNQPARCGEFSVSLTEESNQSLSTYLQPALGSLVMGFAVQSLKLNISPTHFNKLSAALEFCTLVIIAGPVLGTLSFTFIESVRLANRRFQCIAESNMEVAIQALPIVGLFSTARSSSLAQASLSIATNITSAIAGSKLADLVFRR